MIEHDDMLVYSLKSQLEYTINAIDRNHLPNEEKRSCSAR